VEIFIIIIIIIIIIIYILADTSEVRTAFILPAGTFLVQQLLHGAEAFLRNQ
jgi:hypothetical protein